MLVGAIFQGIVLLVLEAEVVGGRESCVCAAAGQRRIRMTAQE